MQPYILGPVVVVAHGVMVLIAVWMVVLAGRISSLGCVPGKWFVVVGLGLILSAAAAIGVTMYAMSAQPEWWHRGDTPFAALVCVGILVGLCLLTALGLVGKEARR